MGLKDIAIITAVVILGVGFLTFSDAAKGSAGYSDVCDAASNETIMTCDETKLFECKTVPPATDGICGCKPQMYYDRTQGMCIVEAEGPCVEFSNDGQIHTVCTNNSRCDQTLINTPGKCQCCPTCIKDDIGLCRLGHNADGCVYEFDCIGNAFLTCSSESKCVCDQNLAVWDATECKSLVGGKCEGNGTEDGSRKCMGAGETIACINDTCACTDGHMEAPDGRCLLKHGEVCVDNAACHPNFQCIKGQVNETLFCECPATHIWDEGKQVCLILAGEVCNANVTEELCFPNSHCDSATSHCSCNENYSQNSEKFCKANLDNVCTAEEDCNIDLYLTCSNATEKTCVCKDNYSPLDGKCIGGFGAGCSENADCKSNVCGDTEKTCMCPEGSMPSADNSQCLFGYGQSCDADRPCDTRLLFSCAAGTCDCSAPDDMIYEESQCKIKAGKACGEGRPCALFSNCAAEVCVCLNGYSTNSTTGLCSPGGGSGSSNLAPMSFGLATVLISLVIMFTNTY